MKKNVWHQLFSGELSDAPGRSETWTEELCYLGKNKWLLRHNGTDFYGIEEAEELQEEKSTDDLIDWVMVCDDYDLEVSSFNPFFDAEKTQVIGPRAIELRDLAVKYKLLDCVNKINSIENERVEDLREQTEDDIIENKNWEIKKKEILVPFQETIDSWTSYIVGTPSGYAGGVIKTIKTSFVSKYISNYILENRTTPSGNHIIDMRSSGFKISPSEIKVNFDEVELKTKITWNQEKYIKAWNFASVAHQEQLVPGTKNPYINHIGLVAMEALATLSNSKNIDNPDLLVQCALLHDTIEDTDLNYDAIEYEFGKKVADGVLALTKNKKFKTKVEKMGDSLSRIKEQSKEVWMVKLCDRITNLQPPPLHWDKDKIQAYYYESITILESLGSANDFLKDRLKEKIDNYKYFLGQFEVIVDDNWDIYDESERYSHSTHETFEAAVECCKKIVDDDLKYMLKEHGIDKLYGVYCLGGESPSIRPTPDGKEFSARVYAEERCNQIEKELNEKQSS